MPPLPIIAADVGNARTKLGLFAPGTETALPEPAGTLRFPNREPIADRITTWLEGAAIDGATDLVDRRLAWWIGSVNRPAVTRLLDWLHTHRPDDPITLLSAADLPLEVTLPRADMVGIDRLLDAMAANRLREPGRAAIVADLGSAITVDAISAAGEFRGGAILPGIGMSARAMHEFTDLLPPVEMSELATPPPALGTSTEPAMRSGLYWGAVGAIRELISRLSEDGHAAANVFITGGAGPAVVELIGRSARHVPHLTLAGIALAAQARRQR